MKIVHYAAVAVLLLGAVYYFWMKPPSLNPIADHRAADALAMVQSSRAVDYPTILQAMTGHVRSMNERNRGARLGEWRVKQVEGDLYEIRVQLRDRRGERSMVRTGIHLACRSRIEKGQCRVASC